MSRRSSPDEASDAPIVARVLARRVRMEYIEDEEEDDDSDSISRSSGFDDDDKGGGGGARRWNVQSI